MELAGTALTSAVRSAKTPENPGYDEPTRTFGELQ